MQAEAKNSRGVPAGVLDDQLYLNESSKGLGADEAAFNTDVSLDPQVVTCYLAALRGARLFLSLPH